VNENALEGVVYGESGEGIFGVLIRSLQDEAR
jgi:hypothetical protein